MPSSGQYGWHRPSIYHVEGCPSLSTCMEDPLKVFHFTSVSWVVLGGGKTGFRPTFALFRPIRMASAINLPCGRLPLPFYMYGGPFEGVSLHLSVMGWAGWWKNRFQANICPLPANIGQACTMHNVACGFCGVEVLLWPYGCCVLS